MQTKGHHDAATLSVTFRAVHSGRVATGLQADCQPPFERGPPSLAAALSQLANTNLIAHQCTLLSTPIGKVGTTLTCDRILTLNEGRRSAVPEQQSTSHAFPAHNRYVLGPHVGSDCERSLGSVAFGHPPSAWFCCALVCFAVCQTLAAWYHVMTGGRQPSTPAMDYVHKTDKTPMAPRWLELAAAAHDCAMQQAHDCVSCAALVFWAVSHTIQLQSCVVLAALLGSLGQQCQQSMQAEPHMHVLQQRVPIALHGTAWHAC